MTTESELVGELVQRLMRVEHEIELLREDRKNLLGEYKDKLDIKVFQAALRIAKIKARLSSTSEDTLDSVLEVVEDKFAIDWID
tara:strand:+ start:256 stop:507 length:252 start_codon:yes stop_codon:yes gene_type:complete